jgi:hypothetical protein
MKRIHLNLDVASPRNDMDGGMDKSAKEFSGYSLRDRLGVRMSSRAPKTVTSQEPHSDRRRACQNLTEAKLLLCSLMDIFCKPNRFPKSTAGQALRDSPRVLPAPMQFRTYTAQASARYLKQDPSNLSCIPPLTPRNNTENLSAMPEAPGGDDDPVIQRPPHKLSNI